MMTRIAVFLFALVGSLLAQNDYKSPYSVKFSFPEEELIGDLLWVRAGGRRTDALAAGRTASLHWWRGKLWGLVPLVGLTPFGRLGGDLLPTTAVGMDDCVYFHEAGRPRPSVIALPHVDELRTG